MDNLQTHIENYLDGQMNAEEQQTFEKQLQTDSTLSEAYEKERLARQLITEAGRLDIKNTLNVVERDLQKEGVPTSETKVLPLWVKRALPLAAMVIIFLGVFQWMQTSGITSAEVYDSYFEPYASPSVVRDSDEIAKVNWETATRLYSEQKYMEALPYFQKAGQEVPLYLSEFYRGVSHLSLEAPYYQRAITAFDEVLATDNDYNEQALWYKALALLEIQQKEEALAILNTIVNRKSYNYREAEEILKLKLK